jgi:hypothetical protein
MLPENPVAFLLHIDAVIGSFWQFPICDVRVKHGFMLRRFSHDRIPVACNASRYA